MDNSSSSSNQPASGVSEPSGTVRSRGRENTRTSSGQDGTVSRAGSKRAHFVLSGKGGIGKSWIASLIAQALAERGEPVVCLDADPVNASLTEVESLKAEPVPIFLPDSDEPDIAAMDTMIERVLREPATVIVDNGAAGFVPVSRYLLQPGLAEALDDAGKSLVVHTIVAGGVEFRQTVRGFDSLAQQFPAAIPIVLWLNEFHGPVTGANKMEFEETPVFHRHKTRISAVVRLPALDRQYRKSVGEMTTRGLTFAEVLNGHSELTIMDKQRLAQVRRAIFAQLEGVL